MVATQEDPCGCTHFPPSLKFAALCGAGGGSGIVIPSACSRIQFAAALASSECKMHRGKTLCVLLRAVCGRDEGLQNPSSAERVHWEEVVEGSSVKEMETENPPGPCGVAVSLDPCPRVPLWSPACSDDAVAPPGHCSPSFVPEPYFSPRHRSAVEKLCLLDTTSCGSPGLFVSFLVRSVSCWASGFLFPARPALEGLGASDMCRMRNAGASGLSLGWTDGHRAGQTDTGLEAV